MTPSLLEALNIVLFDISSKELKQQTCLPVFGQVKEIRHADFLEAVDKVDPRVYVVVHLYESAISGCVRMNRMLEEIAPSLKNTKFLRMNVRYMHASDDFSDDVCTKVSPSFCACFNGIDFSAHQMNLKLIVWLYLCSPYTGCFFAF